MIYARMKKVFRKGLKKLCMVLILISLVEILNCFYKHLALAGPIQSCSHASPWCLTWLVEQCYTLFG